MSWECPCDCNDIYRLEDELEEAQDKIDELQEKNEELEGQLDSIIESFGNFIYHTITDDELREFMKDFKGTEFQDWLHTLLPEILDSDKDLVIQIALVVIRDKVKKIPKSRTMLLSVAKEVLTPKQYKIFKERWDNYEQDY